MFGLTFFVYEAWPLLASNGLDLISDNLSLSVILWGGTKTKPAGRAIACRGLLVGPATSEQVLNTLYFNFRAANFQITSLRSVILKGWN